jgi:Cu+-exporting ATPase
MQVKDPVCGMTIDSKDAVAQAKYEGKTYYFCSEQCRKTFEGAPQRYADASGKEGERRAGESKH